MPPPRRSNHYNKPGHERFTLLVSETRIAPASLMRVNPHSHTKRATARDPFSSNNYRTQPKARELLSTVTGRKIASAYCLAPTVATKKKIGVNRISVPVNPHKESREARASLRPATTTETSHSTRNFSMPTGKTQFSEKLLTSPGITTYKQATACETPVRSKTSVTSRGTTDRVKPAERDIQIQQPQLPYPKIPALCPLAWSS